MLSMKVTWKKIKGSPNYHGISESGEVIATAKYLRTVNGFGCFQVILNNGDLADIGGLPQTLKGK